MQAGQAVMMFSARLRFELRASSCSSVQHTSLSCHLVPQIPTSLVRSAASGVSASPLSGQGKSDPKNPCFPQCPRIAHRPASCIFVQPSAAETTGPIRALAPKSDSAAIGSMMLYASSSGGGLLWRDSCCLILFECAVQRAISAQAWLCVCC